MRAAFNWTLERIVGSSWVTTTLQRMPSSCCVSKDLPCALGTITPMSWRLCGNWKVCVPSGTWNSVRRAKTNLHHCSSGETVRGEPARSVANCCLSVKTVRDEHVNSLVRPAAQKLKSVVCVCGTSEKM